MCKPSWIGVDLGKQTFSAAVASQGTRPADWASLAVEQFPHDKQGITAFVRWVKRHTGKSLLGVCVEATGRLSWSFMDALKGRLGCVCLVNPARPHDYAKSIGLRSKTDRIDACVLALYGLAMTPVPTALPDSRQRQLRELARLHERAVSDQIACRNQLGEPYESSLAKTVLRKKLRALEKEAAVIEAEMDRLIAQDQQSKADIKRMLTVPGVGPKTARLMVARFGDLRRYSRNELVALIGVYPREHSSGTSVHKKPRMAKAGERRIRANLYLSAMNARRFNPHFKQYSERLGARGLQPMEILGAIMRKLVLTLRAVVVTGTDFEPDRQNRRDGKEACA